MDGPAGGGSNGELEASRNLPSVLVVGGRCDRRPEAVIREVGSGGPQEIGPAPCDGGGPGIVETEIGGFPVDEAQDRLKLAAQPKRPPAHVGVRAAVVEHPAIEKMFVNAVRESEPPLRTRNETLEQIGKRIGLVEEIHHDGISGGREA